MQDSELLDGIAFGFFGPYPVAGMAEPWPDKAGPALAALKARGIGAVLTLTEEDPFRSSYEAAGLSHAHVPMDDGEPPDCEAMDRALAFIKQCLEKGQGVAIHCLEGRGRTGTVLCAWLAARESLSFEEAVIRARTLRPLIVFSPSQKAFLSRYIPKLP